MERTPVNPEALRALAHPSRLALLDALGTSGPGKTATECAEILGESVASCSYHLRQLERFGLVVPAERRGREKPYLAASMQIEGDSIASSDDLASVRIIASHLLSQETGRMMHALQRAKVEDESYPAIIRAKVRVSAAQFDELAERVQVLVNEYTAQHASDPSAEDATVMFTLRPGAE
ncbi:ArsR/SmtB family transcription factor [Humidisolicoccus flavus]|uniref:ArsR/SmtB family transcription factor n=1 Tax=Humidisolicoccus flavus TaxID=3111414 RepID=UPI0032544FB3